MTATAMLRMGPRKSDTSKSRMERENARDIRR